MSVGSSLAEVVSMQKWRAPHLAAVAVVGLVLSGCGRPPSGSDEPMPTTGPNQVVIKVPGMT
jgi:hypothetical protein